MTRQTARGRIPTSAQWATPWRLERWFSGRVWTRDYRFHDGAQRVLGFTVADIPKSAGGRGRG